MDMDPTKLLPAPPATTDPITWIALAFVCVFVLVALVGIPRLLAFSREERREVLADAKAERAQVLAAADARHRDTIAAFREELAEERELRSKELAAVHSRLDVIHRDLLNRAP